MEYASIEVRAPNARLFVRDYGGNGAPVILLHGGPGVPDYLGSVAEVLTGINLHVVGFDQRGVGKSASLNNRYDIHDYLDDLESIRSHFGFEKVHLVGHSWGGLYAQLYAKVYPERILSLFLSSPALGVGQDWKRNESEVMKYNKRQSGSAGFVAFGLLWLLASLPDGAGHAAFKKVMQRVWKNYFLEPQRAPPADEQWLEGVNRRAFVATANSATSNPRALDGLEKVAAEWPVAVLYGKHDIYGDGIDIVYSRFPNAQKFMLENSGHLPWLQVRNRFADILKHFYKL